MKQILKQGTIQTIEEEYVLYTLRCGYCGCEFNCTADEFHQSGGMDNTVCPCCGKYIDPYTWTEIDRKTCKRTRRASGMYEAKLLYK